MPCSLRNARQTVARKYARWFVGQNTHVPQIKLLAGCGDDISTAPLDHHPIFTHPPAHAQVDDMCVEAVDMDLIVKDTEGGGRKSCSFECWPSDGGREIGEGGVGNVMAPRCDGVVENSAEVVPTVAKYIGDFLSTPVSLRTQLCNC